LKYRDASLWLSQVDADQPPRAPLIGDLDADVAIVGGGFTGLWSAYHLISHDPTLRIVIVEKEIVGFGASGRNGGWASALYPQSDQSVARRVGEERARLLRRTLNNSVDEIGKICLAEDIDAGFAKGGTLTVARSLPQERRLRRHFEQDLPWIDGLEWLDKSQTESRVGMHGATSATFNPHCARIHPARLVRGLARAVERRGVRIFEQSPALSIEPKHVRTSQGALRAEVVIRGTEAFSTQFGTSDQRRSVVPTYSLMVATEPLSEQIWSAIKLAQAETFTEACHLIVYGQRTADGRLAIGGRGAPYHFASRISPDYDRVPRVFGMLKNLAHEWFPVLEQVQFTHAWGGALGIARDWHPHVRFDPQSGLASAGGYVGDGVTNSYLAGATLADLILERDTDLRRLPWVDHHSPLWEREPLRWIGINAGLQMITWADKEERVTNRESLLARAVAPLIGNL
jgi:glycine/D-amino acid oxidase-like deaminating enzyme